MTDSQKLDLILKSTKMIESDVGTLKQDVSMLKDKTNLLEDKLDSLQGSVERLEGRVSGLESNAEKTESRLLLLEECAAGMERRLEGLSCKMTSMENTLETETNRNIRIVAENHVDLYRRFHQASEITTGEELMKININRHENEIRRLKEIMRIAS